MPRKKTAPKAKEPVRIREKKLSNGNVSLYLDYYKGNGRREYEFLNLYLIPEITEDDKKANKAVMKSAAAIKSIRNLEITEGRGGLKKSISKRLLLYDWVMKCADDADKEVKEGQNRHTWGRMLRQTAEALKEYDEDAKLADVDKEFVKGFINWLQYGYKITRTSTRGGIQNEGAHLSPSTANKKYSCFRFALNKAEEEGKITINPCRQINKKEKIKVPESKRAYLTIEELRRLIATPTKSSQTRQVYLFMCFCGLRISDVKQLKWGDIEQSGERWRIIKMQQKTDDCIYLPLSDNARRYLPKRGEKTATEKVFDDIPTEPAMNRALKKWAHTAGIEKNITLHTARHTFATTLLTKGAGLYTVSKLLGHKDVSTTKIYTKVVDSEKDAAVNLLNEL